MRAIMLMFDSLKKDWIPPYGTAIKAPNFARLAEHTAVFDNFYIGSMPCMPARRDLHTGRYSFLHRGWSPLEPFDDSVPELLDKAGIHTHIVSDHLHYWRDGGANYHGRYSTYEHIRGQEGDQWKAKLNFQGSNTAMIENVPPFLEKMLNQDSINREYMPTEALHSQTLTFGAGLEFIETNKDADQWLLTVECFDPHEPFFTYEEYQRLYPNKYQGRHIDWPQPASVTQDDDYVDYVQGQYKALVSMIDKNLGSVLDSMDKHDMWKDTMLIVNTDHGLLLGEHDWWSKGVMPPYQEIANLPFFLWDPRASVRGEHRTALAQNIDVAATLLDYFDQPIPKDMEGKSLLPVLKNDSTIHDSILYGYFGGSTNITDGRFTYMRGPISPENSPLNEYTLIPAHMSSRAHVEDLQHLTLAEPFAFTKGCSTLKIDVSSRNSPFSNMYRYGNRLYDLEQDPLQKTPMQDTDIELMLIRKMMKKMKENDAPPEQYERLGLWENMTEEDLKQQVLTFFENQKMEILPELNWTIAAGNQFKTLVALLQGKDISPDFATYIKNNNITIIEPKHVYSFAEAFLEPKQASMVMMMLSLTERTD